MRRFIIGLSLLSLFALTAMAPGDPAPDFAAKNQDGKIVHRHDFDGKYLVLYFYPKDDTPGCTTEACSFRDQFSLFKSRGAAVLGVSRQDAGSHQEFRAKHHLPFDLLVDDDGSLARAYGVGTMPVIGFAKRESVLIGPDGRVVQFYAEVDPRAHVQQVLHDIDSARAQQPSAK